MFVDLALGSVLLEQASQNALSSHPLEFAGVTSLAGTTTLSDSLMTSLLESLLSLSPVEARADGDRLADDDTILDELTHGVLYKWIAIAVRKLFC